MTIGQSQASQVVVFVWLNRERKKTPNSIENLNSAFFTCLSHLTKKFKEPPENTVYFIVQILHVIVAQYLILKDSLPAFCYSECMHFRKRYIDNISLSILTSLTEQ